MVNTQSALNLGLPVEPRVAEWLVKTSNVYRDNSNIDPFFGCSTALPYIMVRLSFSLCDKV